MFISVGANDYNIDVIRFSLLSYCLPLFSGQFNWITRVGNHAYTKAKIISGNPVCEAVAFALNIDVTKLSQCLLDGVNPKISSLKMSCESLAQSCLSDSWQAGKNI